MRHNIELRLQSALIGLQSVLPVYFTDSAGKTQYEFLSIYSSAHPSPHLVSSANKRWCSACSLQPLPSATAARETVERVGSFCILPQFHPRPPVFPSPCRRVPSQSPNSPAQLRLLSFFLFQLFFSAANLSRRPPAPPRPAVPRPPSQSSNRGKGTVGCRKPSKAASEWKLGVVDVCVLIRQTSSETRAPLRRFDTILND